MSVSAADKIFLGVSLISFGGLFVFLGVALHLAYTKMDMMLDHLKNCPAVMNRASFKNGGPWGRLFVLGGIVGVIKTPGLYIPDGGACIEDVAKFPGALKVRLITLYRVGFFFAWTLMLCSLVFLVEWSSMGPARLGVAALTTVAIPVWVLLCLRLGKTQVSTIIVNFKNSSALKNRVKLNAGGYFGRLVFIVAASVIVTCGRVFIRRGTVDPVDYKKAPRSLRGKLFALFVMEAVLIISLSALYLSGK